MEEKEIWKDIKGYEDYYQASNLGRVKSLPRLVQNGNRIVMLKERILKDGINEKGYHNIQLSRDGKAKTFIVSRLIYETFVGDIPYGLQVNHIDECKDNNAISNLNLMTAKENCNWGTRTERGHRNAKKKVILDNYKEFDSIIEAAAYLGCSRAIVTRCCKNPNYTIFGHHFKYKEESKQ